MLCNTGEPSFEQHSWGRPIQVLQLECHLWRYLSSWSKTAGKFLFLFFIFYHSRSFSFQVFSQMVKKMNELLKTRVFN